MTNEMPTASADSRWGLQSRLLLHVSRTFALTIPQLPKPLERSVGNGYLLCRIADTIEDDPNLGLDDKLVYFENFLQVLNGEACAEEFAATLHDALSDRMLPAERELVKTTPEILALTRTLSNTQQQALIRCATIMSYGMHRFQTQKSLDGLPDVPEMSHYCYAVAGVVGEMLTELFCDYSEEMNAHRDEMMPLALCFGQGLQLTNILKDIWEDQQDGSCWLPRTAFSADEQYLGKLIRTEQPQGLTDGINQIIGIAHSNLESAIRYSQFIPKSEVGIRRFCLWAIGMATVTLKKIHRNPGYHDGDQVKITRRQVGTVVHSVNAINFSNQLVNAWFRLTSNGLPDCADASACDPHKLQQLIAAAQFGKAQSGTAQSGMLLESVGTVQEVR